MRDGPGVLATPTHPLTIPPLRFPEDLSDTPKELQAFFREATGFSEERGHRCGVGQKVFLGAASY